MNEAQDDDENYECADGGKTLSNACAAVHEQDYRVGEIYGSDGGEILPNAFAVDTVEVYGDGETYE